MPVGGRYPYSTTQAQSWPPSVTAAPSSWPTPPLSSELDTRARAALKSTLNAAPKRVREKVGGMGEWGGRERGEEGERELRPPPSIVLAVPFPPSLFQSPISIPPVLFPFLFPLFSSFLSSFLCLLSFHPFLPRHSIYQAPLGSAV